MTAAQPAARLASVAVEGVAGLPAVELQLGPVTALVGPRASGKSQLLATISWLIAGGPRPAASGSTPTRACGSLAVGDRLLAIERRRPAKLIMEGAPAAQPLPASSYLRARDRFSALAHGAGASVGRRLAQMSAHVTTDAESAEALVSVMEACCRDCFTGELLLIEEPELHLAPQAQRYLYRLLRRFAEGGNQILYSTRSPAFVDAAHHDEIVRLDMRGGARTVRRTSAGTLSDPERVRLAAEFDHERSEMFFAQAVVLVEGQTERLSLPFIFRALGHDPDAEGIAIVEVGGKANLPLAARLLDQLSIPFLIVFDADRGAEAAALDAEIRRAARAAPLFRLQPDFEAVAGITSHDDKVLHAWQRFARADAEAVPKALAEIVDEASRLA